MNKYLSIIIFGFLFILSGLPLHGQESKTPDDRPKLVVGIVVDQMRYEYLPRFWSKFGDDGFKRLVNEGYSFTNNHFNYFPTYTGPGHAAIYTGTTPSVNGIVGNSWFDRSGKKGMYVVSDTLMQTVGGEGNVGRMSPVNLLSTTVTDELKQGVTGAKVIAVSVKDRGAVLPAGHLGDGAYWYDDETGRFITRSWYGKQLPGWVQDFNERALAKKYSQKKWQPLYDMDQYNSSNQDNSPYEGTLGGEGKPVFPHAMDSSLSTIKTSPYGNTLVAKIAQAAVEGRSLGDDLATDFLAVSFSSTDYVGHRFGPNSIELADTYARLDRDIAELLSHLDEQVGEGNYLVFLTSDHGAVDVPASLNDRGLPGGRFDSRMAFDSLQTHLKNAYGDESWIATYRNQQVYLNRELIAQKDVSLQQIQQRAAQFLKRFEGVISTNTAYNFETKAYTKGLQAMYQRGHNPERSGDIYIQLAPGWLDYPSEVGTSHGSPYNYDTHVPLLFYGWNIPQGSSNAKTVIPQIAPTISTMLQIEFPNGSDANVLQFK